MHKFMCLFYCYFFVKIGETFLYGAYKLPYRQAGSRKRVVFVLHTRISIKADSKQLIKLTTNKISIMKKFTLFFAALTMSVGSVLAAEGIAYTVTATHGTSKSYTTECDIVVDGITWTVQGNTTMNGTGAVGGWAVGGKSITNQDRAIYSKDAIKANIKKVVVTHNANNGITVNSFALIVSAAANAAGDTVYATAADITAMADKGAVVTFTIPEGKTWNNKYYKFLYNLTNTYEKNGKPQNKRIEFLKAEFSGEYTEVAATAIVLDLTTLEIEQYETAKLVATLTPADATTDIVWTSSDEKVATVKAGTVTALSAGTTTITATAGTVSTKCEVTVKAATALTCAEVVELAKDLKDNEVLAGGKRIVRGYVTEYYKDPAADFEEHGNYSVYMADTKDGGKVFEAYQVKPIDGKTVVKVGDYVEVIGEITKYTDKDNNTIIETVGRGAATIKVIDDATSVEDATVAPAKAVKVVENGQLIIIRDGIRYNAVGAVIE